jgi:hypothetical protein
LSPAVSPIAGTALGIYLSYHSVTKAKTWHHSLICYHH